MSFEFFESVGTLPAIGQKNGEPNCFPIVARASETTRMLHEYLSYPDNRATLFAREMLNLSSLTLNVLLVESGLLAIRSTNEGFAAIEFAREGDCIALPGEAQQRLVQNYSIEALEDSRLNCVSHKRMVRIASANDGLHHLVHSLSYDMLRHLKDRLNAYAQLSPRERYQHFAKSEGGMIGRLRQKDIAAYLGIGVASIRRYQRAVSKAGNSRKPSGDI